MRVLAVDFGTSNTVAALSVDGGPPRLVTVDSSPLVPSAVYLADDGALAVGRDAIRQSRRDPSRFEPNPKRRVDESEILLGHSTVPVRSAIAAVLGRIGTEVRRQLGEPADEVRLTHPARWGARRRAVLVAAAREAGLVRAGAEPILVAEPIAAATHFATLSGAGLPRDRALAVYDLGGGTFDAAIVQNGAGGYAVTAAAGLPDLGGLDFDQAIIEHIGRTRVDAGPDPAARAAWAALLSPVDAASRRLHGTLASDVRDGKEALSRYPHTDIALPEPFSDLHLTRAEFEALIRPNLIRSAQLLGETMRSAGHQPGELVGVYLVGGSSRIPLVARLIQEHLGITPTTLDQPETSVATGALYLRLPGERRAAAGPVAPVSGEYPTLAGGVGASPARPSSPVSPGPPPGTGQRSAEERPSAYAGKRASGGRLGGAGRRGALVGGGLAILLLAAAAWIVAGPGLGGRPHRSATTRPAATTYDSFFTDPTLRAYVRPSYRLIASCRAGAGRSVSLSAIGGSLVDCTYQNGYEAVFGRVDPSVLGTTRAALTGTITLGGVAHTVRSEHNAARSLYVYLIPPPDAGTTSASSSAGPSSRPTAQSILYWDTTASGIFGRITDSKTADYVGLESWWRANLGSR